jgi:hypothetical protein
MRLVHFRVSLFLPEGDSTYCAASSCNASSRAETFCKGAATRFCWVNCALATSTFTCIGLALGDWLSQPERSRVPTALAA